MQCRMPVPIICPVQLMRPKCAHSVGFSGSLLDRDLNSHSASIAGATLMRGRISIVRLCCDNASGPASSSSRNVAMVNATLNGHLSGARQVYHRACFSRLTRLAPRIPSPLISPSASPVNRRWPESPWRCNSLVGFVAGCDMLNPKTRIKI
eukprot:3438135-Pyramimonas_sp.AAC.1